MLPPKKRGAWGGTSKTRGYSEDLKGAKTLMFEISINDASTDSPKIEAFPAVFSIAMSLHVEK
jgi:hypothetical protein